MTSRGASPGAGGSGVGGSSGPGPGRIFCNLHDCLSLGEVERELQVNTNKIARRPSGEAKQSAAAAVMEDPSAAEQVRRRLPMLLRLLQDSRPLSSVPDLFRRDGEEKESAAQAAAKEPSAEGEHINKAGGSTKTKGDESGSDLVVKNDADAAVQGAVNRLEDCAASDPTAEDAERVSCLLAPAACRRMIRHKKALRTMSSREIQAMLEASKASSSKRPKHASASGPQPVQHHPEDDGGEDDDDLSDSGRSEAGGDPAPPGALEGKAAKKRRRVSSAGLALPSRASLIQMARGEDSPEAAVSRTLEELVRLVHTYSTRGRSADREDSAAADGDPVLWLDDVMDDSLLAQEGRSQKHRHAAGGGGAGGGIDVPSTVAALLHHAPQLQASDVAEALCRSALPQASTIAAAVGANAPATVPGLAAGCLRALQRPSAGGAAPWLPRRRRDATSAAARTALRALADLSPRESARVRSAVASAAAIPGEHGPQMPQHCSRADRSMLLGLRLELLVAAAAAAGDDNNNNNDDCAAAALEVACLVNEQFASAYHPNGHPRGGDHADVERQSDDDREDGDEEDDAAGEADASGGKGRGEDEGGAGGSPVESESSRHLPSRSQQGQSMLYGILCENHDLLRQALHVLRNDLARQRDVDQDQLPTARFSIVAAAVTWILLTVPLGKRTDKDGADIGFEDLLHELQAWATRIRSLLVMRSQGVMGGTGLERAVRVLTCASFAGLCAAIRLGDPPLDRWSDCCCSVLSDLLLHFPQLFPNPCVSSFAARFLMRAGQHDALSLVEALLLRVETPIETTTEPNEIVAKACQRLCSEFSSEQQATICLGRPVSVDAPIDLEYGLELAWDVLLPETTRSNRLRELLERLLEKSAAVHHIQNATTPAFIESAVCFFSHRSGTASLPIIHPVTLERLAMPLTFERSRSLSLDEKHFILCVYYCFVYHHFAKSDIFLVDFRSLPVVAVRHVCKDVQRFGLSASLGSRLCCWIDHFCPEMHQKKAYSYDVHDEASRITKSQLLRILRTSIETPRLDPSGILAEKAFIAARSCLPESTYVTTTVSALFSEPNNLPPFFTYASLYRDPLVLLKCSLDVLKSRGLRRIVLSIIESLVNTNDRILQEAAPHDEIRLELRDARNLLLIRSLVTLMTAEFDPSKEYQRIPTCSLTLFFIRREIARNPGLFSALLKQGLPDVTVDWMIDWVPECVVDSSRICALLTQRSSLGAPERLSFADGAFRVAVMQGGFGSDDVSKQLVMAALSHLVTSFFLVLGPVGVPVASILGSGHDATMVSRNAAFRILNAMRRVPTYRVEVRNECIVAVQKLVGLCKGENILAGLPGAIASRQKKLLKELLEALSRANNAMGNAQAMIQHI